MPGAARGPPALWRGLTPYLEPELPEPDAPLEPEPEVPGELPDGEVELLPEPDEPLDMPDDPVELEPDFSKYCCHSERDTCPSPFLSTALKLGAEEEAPEAPLLLVPEDPVLADPPVEDDGEDEDDEADGLDDEPLDDEDLSPAPMAVVAKPKNAAVTAAVMSFNVMDEVSCVDEGLQPGVLQMRCRVRADFSKQIQRASAPARARQASGAVKISEGAVDPSTQSPSPRRPGCAAKARRGCAGARSGCPAKRSNSSGSWPQHTCTCVPWRRLSSRSRA